MGSSGGPINTLTVSCSGGAPLTSFTWSASGAACGANFTPSGKKTQGDTVKANTSTTAATTCTYTATVDNGSGAPQAPTATVTVAAVTVGLQACSGPGLLGGAANTEFENPIPWMGDSGNTNATSKLKNGPMGPGKAYVGVINVPAGLQPNPTNVGYIDVHEYGPSPFWRWVTVSKTPCDFQQPAPGNIYAQYDSTNVIRFTIGPNSLGYVPMNAGETWYVNVRVVNPANLPALGCPSHYCDFATSMHAPAGTF